MTEVFFLISFATWCDDALLVMTKAFYKNLIFFKP